MATEPELFFWNKDGYSRRKRTTNAARRTTLVRYIARMPPELWTRQAEAYISLEKFTKKVLKIIKDVFKFARIDRF